MEDVLDVYQGEYSDEHPLICMDEASKQLLEDTYLSIPIAAGRVRREDVLSLQVAQQRLCRTGLVCVR